MRQRHSIIPYAAACLLTLGGVGAHRLWSRTPIDASTYHARIRTAVDAIPWRIGTWVGEKAEVPPAAIALLKPNALLGRTYRNQADHRVVQLVVVQCEDTRDMAGHYPPICFRANGWRLLKSEQVGPKLGMDASLPVTRYVFDRSSAFETSQRWVYNMLILPLRGGVTDMDEVRKAASNQRARQRGAGQLQLVMSGDIPEGEQEEFVREFLGAVQPVIKDIIQFDQTFAR